MKLISVLAVSLSIASCAFVVVQNPNPVKTQGLEAKSTKNCTKESLSALPPDLKDCTCAGNDTWECTRVKPTDEGYLS